MTTLSVSVVLFRLVVMAASAAALRSPVAMIEDITSGPPGIQPMDYVEAGEVLELGQQGTIVIDYLRSCWHETIAGGTLVVGTVQSEVRGGRIERFRTPCDAGKMLITAHLATMSAGAEFRATPLAGQPRPEFTLYGVSPVLEVKPIGTLVIERLDQPGLGIALVAGGIYRAKAGAQQMIFQIDPDAASGESPLVGRLVRLQPAS
jgi:hypothetical protein